MATLSSASLSPPLSKNSPPSTPPANRQRSRSPQPYRRRAPPSPSMSTNECLPTPSLTPSPGISRAHSPLDRKNRSCRASESGTEADDELARKLPAPPGRRKKSSSDEDYVEVYDGESGERGRRKKSISGEAVEKRRRKGIVFARRGIELGLMLGLVVVVVLSGNGRVWSEVVYWRKEIATWLLVLASSVLSYPLRIIRRRVPLQLPRSLDPSPLLYPIFIPLLVSLTLTPKDPQKHNSYLLVNSLLSLSSIPPIFIPSRNLQWLLSLCPLVPSSFSQFYANSENNTLSLLPPLHNTLSSSLSVLLHPSLTQTEIRLLATSLINLLVHASSPQAIVLKALLWGGGLGVFLLCEDIIKWNVNLARVPQHRFRRAGHVVLGLGRFKRLASVAERGQAAESEDDQEPLIRKPKPNAPTKQKTKINSGRSFYTSLTAQQAKFRIWAYAGAVYGIIGVIVLFCLRPYFARYVFDGLDPFLWAPGYLLCGQNWYQGVLDYFMPGTGYCVTEGSTSAANLRLMIIGYWAVVLALGISLVMFLSSRVEVDTRRKVFHGMVVAMFVIPGVIDPPFTHLCFTLALVVFLLLDLVRAGQLPPFSGWIARFLQPFVDGRDLKGPVVVSHVFLLIGCGIGWWLTLASSSQENWDWSGKRDLGFVSGVVCVGLGDAAASLIGRRFGKTKWGWRGGKSIEGSAAFMLAVVIGLSVGRLALVGIDGDWSIWVWLKIFAVGFWGSMVEAVVTGANDNVVVPVGVWAVVKGLGL
ncbi:dolichol kinase [Rhizina undulata]